MLLIGRLHPIRRHGRGISTEVSVKKYILFSGLVLMLLITACGGDTAETPTAEVEPLATEPAPALPTFDAVQPEPGYPGPETAEPLPGSPDSSGYPAPPPATPAPESYPEGTLFWMIHPVGLQCEESPIYPQIEDAISALEEQGVEVLRSEPVSMLVCEACGCPTSEHYRVQIEAGDLETAIAIGWTREQ